ncbi:hypothetical protein K440DRAFT_610560 [Wilcoxina mikolae CBS 423.85]|nr:hypothetical protein K440DRAFT_610560 [Wilcoxina mikolae CBS 423.85]
MSRGSTVLDLSGPSHLGPDFRDKMRTLTPAHHLSIEGLCSDHDIAGQIRTLVTSLSFRHGAKISCVEYVSHTITRNERDNDVLHLELSFGETDTADVMQSFCRGVMKPAHETELERISKFGLLGFSPGNNPEFEECLNMASLHVLYVEGSEAFENTQKRALSIKKSDFIPHWFKVLNFVADTVVESHFCHLPSMSSCDLDSIGLQRTQREAQRNEKKSSFSFWGTTELLSIQLLKMWVSFNLSVGGGALC